MQSVVSQMKRVAATAILLIAVLYLGDYLSVRFRIPHNREPLGVVRVQRYYAVSKKDGKPDLYFGQPQNEACVHSLFSHFGDPPCWYLRRRSERRVNE